MDRQQIGLKLAMDSLEIPVQMGTFENRLVLQKAVYLAEAAGVALGYHFRWYLRGPYCPLLASDGFSVETETARCEKEAQRWTLDAVSRKNLKQLRRTIDLKPDDMVLSSWLELLASVHFLVARKQVAGDTDKILHALRKFGKCYTLAQVATARSRLREYAIP